VGQKMSCMKLKPESVQSENISLLLEIYNLKIQLRDLYKQTGPGNTDYISLSIKLDLLQNEFINGKIIDLIGFTENEPLKVLETV
jgi:hypothetical protein